MRIALCSILVATACGSVKHGDTDAPAGGDGPVGDGDGPAGDARIGIDADIRIDVAHVATADEHIGTIDLVMDGTSPIDTDQLTAGVPGIDFVAIPQDGGGPELAVLRVHSFVVAAGATVRVIGSRPLVVIGHHIFIDGRLDGGALGSAAGPGAVSGLTSPRVGGSGHVAGSNNGGGGGGGGGATGGTGGPSQAAAGGAGGSATDPVLATLTGGASGGDNGNPSCPATFGAGGGAIQLSAVLGLSIGGSLNVGGGGAPGGIPCGLSASGGGGGGSGGSIYLQGATLSGTGTVSANGGGGGGGSSNLLGGAGSPGGDATGAAAPVGGLGANGGGDGGAGGAQGAGRPGGPAASGGGGGGGGGTGRIVKAAPGGGASLTFSPPFVAP